MNVNAVRSLMAIERNEAEGRGGNRRLVLRAPADWPEPAPGQFLMLHLAPPEPPRHDPLLPRPMAVYRTERRPDATLLEVLYKVVGRGTSLLAGYDPGVALPVVGPLGRGFETPGAGETALLVGGGTGIASLYGLAAAARAQADVHVLLGARHADDLMGLADFEALGVRLSLATEDGSAGHRGLVTALLERALAEADGPTRVYACGPTPMMQAVAGLAEGAGVPCTLSLENRMACGFGVCLGCAVHGPGEKLHLVCRDGPVFDTTELRVDALP